MKKTYIIEDHTLKDLKKIFGNPKYGIKEILDSILWRTGNSFGIGNSPEKAFEFIKDNKESIIKPAKEFKILPSMIAAILFREMTCYNFLDLFDVVLVNKSIIKDASIGKGQIKIKTALKVDRWYDKDSVSSFEKMKNILLNDKKAIYYVAKILKFEATDKKIQNPLQTNENIKKGTNLEFLNTIEHKEVFSLILGSYNGDIKYYGIITTEYAKIFERYFNFYRTKK